MGSGGLGHCAYHSLDPQGSRQCMALIHTCHRSYQEPKTPPHPHTDHGDGPRPTTSPAATPTTATTTTHPLRHRPLPGCTHSPVPCTLRPPPSTTTRPNDHCTLLQRLPSSLLSLFLPRALIATPTPPANPLPIVLIFDSAPATTPPPRRRPCPPPRPDHRYPPNQTAPLPPLREPPLPQDDHPAPSAMTQYPLHHTPGTACPGDKPTTTTATNAPAHDRNNKHTDGPPNADATTPQTNTEAPNASVPRGHVTTNHTPGTRTTEHPRREDAHTTSPSPANHPRTRQDAPAETPPPGPDHPNGIPTPDLPLASAAPRTARPWAQTNNATDAPRVASKTHDTPPRTAACPVTNMTEI